MIVKIVKILTVCDLLHDYNIASNVSLVFLRATKISIPRNGQIEIDASRKCRNCARRGSWECWNVRIGCEFVSASLLFQCTRFVPKIFIERPRIPRSRNSLALSAYLSVMIL